MNNLTTLYRLTNIVNIYIYTIIQDVVKYLVHLSNAYLSLKVFFFLIYM